MSTEKTEKTGLETAVDTVVSIGDALGKLRGELSKLNGTLIFRKGIDLSETLRPLSDKLEEAEDAANEIYMELADMAGKERNEDEDEEA